MAHHIEETMQFNVSAKKVWDVLNDFSGVGNWHFAVENSPLLPGNTTGVGAKRTCNFYDGTSVKEEITEYHEGKGYIVEITEFSMPLKSLVAETKIDPVGENSCDITIKMDFVVKGGPLGWLMGIFMIKPMMGGLTKKLLKGLAYHAATEKLIGEELPSETDLSLAFDK